MLCHLELSVKLKLIDKQFDDSFITCCCNIFKTKPCQQLILKKSSYKDDK